MSLYKEFVEILIPTELIKIAEFHSEQRTKYIKRQFSPSQAPLTHLESNYIGVLGELAARQYLELEIELKDSYKNNEVDFGDLDVNGLIYDVKNRGCSCRILQFITVRGNKTMGSIWMQSLDSQTYAPFVEVYRWTNILRSANTSRYKNIDKKFWNSHNINCESDRINCRVC